MKKLVYGLIITIIVGIVLYGAITIYGNFHFSNVDTNYSPDKDKAQYSARIKNTGLTFYSNDAVKDGSVLILKGYWELVGDKYKFRDKVLVMDENIFGPIRLVER